MPLTRGGFRHYDYDRMVVRKWHARSAPLPWTTWMDRLEGIHRHIAGVYLLRYAQERSWRGDNGRLSNGEQVNRLAALSLKRGKSVDFGGYRQRHSKDVHA
jgi:hypothetical protein